MCRHSREPPVSDIPKQTNDKLSYTSASPDTLTSPTKRVRCHLNERTLRELLMLNLEAVNSLQSWSFLSNTADVGKDSPLELSDPTIAGVKARGIELMNLRRLLGFGCSLSTSQVAICGQKHYHQQRSSDQIVLLFDTLHKAHIYHLILLYFYFTRFFGGWSRCSYLEQIPIFCSFSRKKSSQVALKAHKTHSQVRGKKKKKKPG